jgi:hypothetical protein
MIKREQIKRHISDVLIQNLKGNRWSSVSQEVRDKLFWQLQFRAPTHLKSFMFRVLYDQT